MQEAAGPTWDLRSLFELFTYHNLSILGVGLLLFLVPVIKLLRRTGHSAAWCLLAIFPVLNLGALWLFAFKPWPTDRPSDDKGN